MPIKRSPEDRFLIAPYARVSAVNRNQDPIQKDVPRKLVVTVSDGDSLIVGKLRCRLSCL